MKKSYIITAMLILFLSPIAQAADLFWDGDGVSPQGGGVGTWDTATAHFSPTSAGTVTTTWSNTTNAGDTAVFNGTAGVVSLSGPIVVNTIRTEVSGYSIGNGNGITNAANTLTFQSNSGTINTTHTSGTTTLTAYLNGQTLIKAGAGRLELNNSGNATTNKFVLNAGAITAPAPSRFGAPASLVQDFFTFNGGGLGANTTTNYDLGANRGVTILSGGAFFGASVNTVITTIGAPIVGTSGGNLTLTGGAPFTGSAHTSGGILVLANTNNSWDGNLILSGPSGSAVRLGTSGVVPDTAVVTISSSGNTFDLATNNVTETVKSISGTAGTIALGTGSLTVANPSGETYSSVLTASAGGKFIKNGSGTLTLSGSSTSFNGEMILNAGKIGIGGSNSLGAGASGSIVTINGGTLANTGTGTRSIPSTVSVNLSGDFSVDDSLNATPGSISFGGPSTIKNSNRTITVSGAANLTFSAAVGEDVAGRSLTKNGNGTLTLNNAANTYSGSTTINAGQVNIDGDGSLGNGNGTLNLAGGTLNTTADRTAAISNPVSVTANSSITTTSTAAGVGMNFTSNSVGGDGTSKLTFRNVGADGATDKFSPRFSGSGFTFSNPIAIENGGTGSTVLELYNTANTTQTFSGIISGDGSVSRSASDVNDAGTTIFTGDNTYTGGTTVNRGTLRVNNTSGSGTGTGAVTVGTGGTLAGIGAIRGDVTVNGGTLAAGNSIGTLNLGSSLTLTSGTFEWEYSDTPAADLVNVNGALSIASVVTLTGFDLGSSVLAGGLKFVVISYATAGAPGTFFGMADDTLVTLDGQDFIINYNDTSAGSVNGGLYANAVTVTTVAVPEASAVAGIGLAGLISLAAVWVGKRRGATVVK